MADIIFITEAKVSLKILLRKKGLLKMLEGHGYNHRFEHVSTAEPIKYGYAGVIVFSKYSQLECPQESDNLTSIRKADSWQ
jgi:hypothetical protein